MKHLLKFNHLSDYNAALPTLQRPNVSLIVDAAVVKYLSEDIYRWVNLDPTVDYICDLETYTKYYKQKKQVSHDGGVSWSDVVPTETQRGDVYQYNSYDCGYPRKKLTLNYSGGSVYEMDCNDNPVLTSGETNPVGYDFNLATSFEIGQCVTEIGDKAFYNFKNLDVSNIPNTLTKIGNSSFSGVKSFTKDTIDLRNVKEIGDVNFACFDSSTSIHLNFLYMRDIEKLGGYALSALRLKYGIVIDNENPPLWLNRNYYPMPPIYTNYSIYVPDSAVETYKTNLNWKNYKDIIKPMSEIPQI